MIEIPTWDYRFNRDLTAWMCRKAHRPGCPDCGNPIVQIDAPIGKPARILFACGHQFESPVAGVRYIPPRPKRVRR